VLKNYRLIFVKVNREVGQTDAMTPDSDGRRMSNVVCACTDGCITLCKLVLPPGTSFSSLFLAKLAKSV
jgi:hypothetical protein